MTVARPGRSPTASDPEARKPAGRNAFPTEKGEKTRSRLPETRDVLFAAGDFVSSNGRFE
jgi:hypothetical protein